MDVGVTVVFAHRGSGKHLFQQAVGLFCPQRDCTGKVGRSSLEYLIDLAGLFSFHVVAKDAEKRFGGDLEVEVFGFTPLLENELKVLSDADASLLDGHFGEVVEIAEFERGEVGRYWIVVAFAGGALWTDAEVNEGLAVGTCKSRHW